MVDSASHNPEPTTPTETKVQRKRTLWIAGIVLCLAVYGMYAGRRTLVEPQSGTGISWPDGYQPVSETRFQVAVYNIQRGKGIDGVRDLDRTAEVLRHADVVGLNEIGGPTFPDWQDQAEQLGKKLNIGWLYAPNQRRWHTYHFGNGLLSRLPVGWWTSEPLVYDHKAHSYRNLLTAEIMVGPQPVTVMVTHIARSEIRPTQLRDVLSEFVKHSPAILIGDLNTKADDPLLIDFFADSNNVDAVAVVFGEDDCAERIDWIITRGMDVFSGGMEPIGVSDHPCYWVDVEVSPTNTETATDASSSAMARGLSQAANRAQ